MIAIGAVALVGCGGPCADLAVELCGRCDEPDRTACMSAMQGVEDADNEDACAAERRVFACETIDG